MAVPSSVASDFDTHLRAMAEVLVRVGVNLQPGQRLLVTEPYELQGVHPETGPLIEAIRATASGHEVTTIVADPTRLRSLVEAGDLPGYEAMVSTHTRRMERHLAAGGAFLFLLGSQRQLTAGLPADRLARFDRAKWHHLGPLVQRLTQGASQWTLAPAPSASWADAAYADLPAGKRLAALWDTVFTSLRVHVENFASTWQLHLAALATRRDVLTSARHRSIRYVGAGTDLTLDLPGSHLWCNAQLITRTGVPFVANLPTEEIFTAPRRNSARGHARIARPITHGGSVIEGIELEFSDGRVTTARATAGQDALELLLATDNGACRIGEVAILPESQAPGWATRLFHHALLDENSGPHIALGNAYRFCSRAWLPLALNTSQVHVDLPVDAAVVLS